MWESYDCITDLLLDFNDLQTRIKSLHHIDQELLLSSVYVQMFRLMFQFIGILTRYVRNNTFGTHDSVQYH